MTEEQAQRLLEEKAAVDAELRVSQRLNAMMHRQMDRVLQRVSELEAEVVRLRRLLDPDEPDPPKTKPTPSNDGGSGNEGKDTDGDKPARPTSENSGRRRKKRKKTRSNKNKPRRGALPDHLERVPDPHPLTACPCCQSTSLHPLPPLVSEKLVYLPARLVVRQTSRDKARCLDCGRLSTAMQPAEAVKHGQLDASVLASLIHSKFALHLPIERILEDWQRMGHTLASSSAQTALARACTLLGPIYAELQRRALSSDVLHCDGTGLDRLLPKQRGKIRSQVRVYCTDGSEPLTVYTFNETKHAERVRKTLRPGMDDGFRGYLVSDFGSEHAGLYASGDIIQVGCWQHVREYFVKARSSSPRAAQQALAYIGALFDIESDSDETFEAAAERLARRRRESGPILRSLQDWMRRQYLRCLPGEPLRVGIEYARTHWRALRRFLDDGAVPLHNNLAERELGVVGRGRKNFLFTGSVKGGERLALLYTIVRTCQRNGVAPYDYLVTVLPKLSVMPANRRAGWDIAELLPMAFKDTEQHAEAG